VISGGGAAVRDKAGAFMLDITYDTSLFESLGDTAEGKAIKRLADNYFMLLKSLRYYEHNLGEENFNEVEWSNLTEPIYARIEERDVVLGTLFTEISVQAGSISAMVEAVGADGEVTAASIVAAVNVAESSVKINADKIDITGEVQFLTPDDVGASGSTTISGNRISTGTLNASLCEVTNISASNITTGTMSANRISGGEIDARYVTISHLDADEIYTGTLQAIDIDSCDITTINSDDEAVRIYDGYIKFYDDDGSDYGKIRYDHEEGKFNIYSNDKMKIISTNDMSLDAGVGDTVAIGQSNSGEIVGIGRVDGAVYLYGDVYVNDVLIS
jgi:hypothetical protein